jgi:peptide/nickel transport system permease protein
MSDEFPEANDHPDPTDDGIAIDTRVIPDEAGAPLAIELGVTDLDVAAEPVALSQWQLFTRRFKRHKLAIGSLVALILIFVLCFVIAPIFLVSPQDQRSNLTLGSTGPSWQHPFGTDELGRDMWARILYGGQISLRIGVGVALVSTLLGTFFGAIAGLYGKAVDQVIMRATDLVLILPAIAVLAVALQRFGQKPNNIVFVLAGLFWMQIARVVRGLTLSLKEKEFVEGARAAGASNFRIIVRHILPNCIGPIMVNLTLSIAVAVITESTLSFLGYGVVPPDVSWGYLLYTARTKYNHDVHLVLFPGLAILVTVLAVNALGDGLRDALDPHAKH